MAQDAIKLEDMRTIVFIEDGRIGEFGGNDYRFQRSTNDTYAMLQLFLRNQEEIIAAYNEAHKPARSNG